jgi:hypothetical protein
MVILNQGRGDIEMVGVEENYDVIHQCSSAEEPEVMSCPYEQMLGDLSSWQSVEPLTILTKLNSSAQEAFQRRRFLLGALEMNRFFSKFTQCFRGVVSSPKSCHF